MQRTQIAGKISGDELNVEKKEEEKALMVVPNEWTNGLIFFLPLCNVLQFCVYMKGERL